MLLHCSIHTFLARRAPHLRARVNPRAAAAPLLGRGHALKTLNAA